MKLDESGKSLEFLMSSSYRWKIMALLLGGSREVSEISEETDIRQSHVSRTLKELGDEGLVECVTPEKRKGRLYAISDEGRRLGDRLGMLLGRPSLESKVRKTFDELSLPYARNVKLKPDARRGTADFVLLDGYEPWMAVAVRSYPEDELKGLKSATFWVSTWSNETENLRTALILGGKSKEEILEEGGSFFLRAGFLDLVLYGEDLDCIREKEPSLKELPSVGKECADWPDLKEKKKDG